MKLDDRKTVLAEILYENGGQMEYSAAKRALSARLFGDEKKLKQATFSVMANRMKQDGYIEIAEDENDRRRRIITLLPKGMALTSRPTPFKELKLDVSEEDFAEYKSILALGGRRNASEVRGLERLVKNRLLIVSGEAVEPTWFGELYAVERDPTVRWSVARGIETLYRTHVREYLSSVFTPQVLDMALATADRLLGNSHCLSWLVSDLNFRELAYLYMEHARRYGCSRPEDVIALDDARFLELEKEFYACAVEHIVDSLVGLNLGSLLVNLVKK